MLQINFFRSVMPSSRKADFHLGCKEGSVFLDFDQSEDKIFLSRISFDGFGCCELGAKGVPLSERESEDFIREIEKDHLNQHFMRTLVEKLIKSNRHLIWEDALAFHNLSRP